MTIESAGSPPAAPPVATVPAKSSWQRMVGVFFAPTETFEDIARKPDIVAPLIVLLVVSILSAVLVMPHLDFDAVVAQQVEMMEKQGRKLSDSDMDQMARITKAMAKVGGYLSPVIMVVAYLLMATVLWGAFRLMGGDGEFKQAFSATLYAWFPRIVVGGVIGAIVIMARGMVDPTTVATVVKSNPAFLVDMKEQPVLFSLLASFDVFALWTLALTIVGFAALSKLSKAKSAAIVLSLWIVTLVIKVGFAALTAARMKG